MKDYVFHRTLVEGVKFELPICFVFDSGTVSVSGEVLQCHECSKEFHLHTITTTRLYSSLNVSSFNRTKIKTKNEWESSLLIYKLTCDMNFERAYSLILIIILDVCFTLHFCLRAHSFTRVEEFGGESSARVSNS